MLDSKKTVENATSGPVSKVGESGNGASSDGSETERVMPSIVDRIAEISARVPMSDWQAAPTDGAKNLKHYLYGWPKDSDT